MPWNDGLEGIGLDIASSNSDTIRVMAGPGTGKTFTLMRRIARLIEEEGVDPRRILLVTFTRTAAEDLIASLQALQLPGVEHIKAGTLHSYCFSVLNKEQVLAINNRAPNILFDFEKDFLLADIARDIGTNQTEAGNKLNAFQAAWARRQNEEPGWPIDLEDQQFQASLGDKLRFLNAMTLSEFVPLTLAYFKGNPLSEELNAYDYVFVDEYQDLNKAEQELISMLAQEGKLMIIGDEDQSIYESFRHANPEGIRTFNQSRQGTVDFNLDISRRSPQKVVRIANTFIQNNANRAAHVLNPRQQNVEGEINSVQWQNMADETSGLATYIKAKINAGINPGQILILAPRKIFGYNLKESLAEEGIAAHCYFKEDLVKDASAKQALCKLRVLVNNNDNSAIRAYVGLESSNKQVNGFRRVKAYCEEHNQSLFDVLTELANDNVNIPHTQRIKARFVELLNMLNELQGEDVQTVFNVLFPEGAEWAIPFREILDSLAPESTLAEILDEITSQIIHPPVPTEADFVRIMSLYKSKGLTADIVVICGFIETIIPDQRNSLPPDRHREEQRRLFYVALTRARLEVLVSSIRALPRANAYQLGARVVGQNPHTTTTITSSFSNEMGGEFPATIAGEEFLGGL